MIFTSPEFLIFFLVFFSGWALLRGRSRKCWLLFASYFFYGSWNVKFLGLLMLSTGVDFMVGKKLGETTDPKRRKLVLSASLVFNLGILGFFKYFNFFVESARLVLDGVGLHVPPHVLNVVLPVGISFYTFQALSYTIDVYRGVLAPTASLLDFATFVAAFPQLVAGPIERARHLLPQIAKLGRSGDDELRTDYSGLLLIALGSFKKAAIADNLAPYVDAAFTNVSQSYVPALWLGTYAFAIQIYCDFSGYSDIAIGLGRLLGFSITQNFRAPYAARGPSDFWTRWHISLSSWLRDYLYIPLGGNRGSALFTARNLMLTMLLGGLWHGAAWSYVLWGGYHGTLLVLGRLPPMAALGKKLDALTGIVGSAARTLQRIVFFHFVCFGWALFRANSLADCATLARKLLSLRGIHWSRWLAGIALSAQAPYLKIAMFVCVCVVALQQLLRIGPSELIDRIRNWPLPVLFGLAATLLYVAAVFAPEQAPPFIYFKF